MRSAFDGPEVRHDVDGHRETVASYKVYRYAAAQHPDSGAVPVPPVVVTPLPGDSLIFTAYRQQRRSAQRVCRQHVVSIALRPAMQSGMSPADRSPSVQHSRT